MTITRHRLALTLDASTRKNASRAKRMIQFKVLDWDDRWVGTFYAQTEVDAISMARSEGYDAWSAYDSLSRHSGGW